jgi:hypothetical protein
LKSGDTIDGGERLHLHAYLSLQTFVRDHFLAGVAPILSESPKPLGGYSAAAAVDGLLADIISENDWVVRYGAKAADELQGIENGLATEQESDFDDKDEELDWINGQ